MNCQKKQRLIFFGDSITELGVNPNGYITLIDSISKAQGFHEFEFIGSGVSGDKVTDLYFRLEKDVLNRDPDVVVIFIGINDVWHKQLLGTGTDPDKFRHFYQSIIDKLKQRSIKIILCTPAVIGERDDLSNELDADLNKYCNIIRRLAHENELPLADFRGEFLTYYYQHNPNKVESGILTYDKVHLNDQGNAFVAEKLWKIIKSIAR